MQRFATACNHKTNGKAVRVNKMIMKLWHDKTRFGSSAHRKTERKCFLNHHNGAPPHKRIGGLTQEEKLNEYFYTEKLYTIDDFLTFDTPDIVRQRTLFLISDRWSA